MTDTRCYLPDQLTDTERRTSELEDVFDDDQERVHAYCLGRASTLHQQEVHAAVALPWKVREVVTDLAGTRGSFTRTFHSLMTHFARRHRGPIDHVWENDRPDEQVCVAAEDAEDREREIFEEGMQACVETWLEPVRAGKCEHPDDYDGFMIGADEWGEELTIERPALASKRTTLPKTVKFTPMPPPGTDMTLADKKAYAKKLLAEQLPEARREGRLARKKPPRIVRPRKRKRPNFRGSAKAVQQAEAEYELWRRFYDECRITFREDQTVVFPAGTVGFRRLGAICDPNPVTRCL